MFGFTLSCSSGCWCFVSPGQWLLESRVATQYNVSPDNWWGGEDDVVIERWGILRKPVHQSDTRSLSEAHNTATVVTTKIVSVYAELTLGVGNKVTLLIQLTPTGPLTPLPLFLSFADWVWPQGVHNTVFRECPCWTDDNTIQANTNCRIIEPWSKYDSSDALPPVWHRTLERAKDICIVCPILSYYWYIIWRIWVLGIYYWLLMYSFLGCEAQKVVTNAAFFMSFVKTTGCSWS